MATLQQLGASEIDIKLAPHQFCDRLCLVKTSLSNTDFAFTPGRTGLDQTVSVNQLWPALKFNTYNELIAQLKMDINTQGIGRIKGSLTVAANKAAQEAGIPLSKAGFAYLLGKGNNNSSNFLIVLPKNDSGDNVDGNDLNNNDGMIFDFFDSMIEMESAQGYCSSPEFQHAFKIVMARMEMADGMVEESGEDGLLPVQVTTVNSAKKTSDQEQQMEVQPKQEQEEDEEEEEEEEAVKEPRRSSPRKKKQDEETMYVPIKTVEFAGKEANASDTSSFEGAEGVEEEETEPTTPLAKGFINWTDMWNNMEDQGWVWLPGSGLVDWYYVHPNFAHRSRPDVLKEGKEGEDYFVNDESLMRYAKQHLGFRGTSASDTLSFDAGGAKDEEEAEPIGRKSPKGIRATPVSNEFVNWTDMWTNMKDQGWNWMTGGGLVDRYYVHPNFARRNKAEVLKKGKEGEDYFVSEEAVMRYAKKYLGFRGRVATPASNNKDWKDGVVERRGRKRSTAAAEPAVETKKEKRDSKVGKKYSKAGKKQANETNGRTKILMSSNSNESVNSGISRFSEGGGFCPGSPTLSEAEADMGVRSASKNARKKLYSEQQRQHNTDSTSDEETSQ